MSKAVLLAILVLGGCDGKGGLLDLLTQTSVDENGGTVTDGDVAVAFPAGAFPGATNVSVGPVDLATLDAQGLEDIARVGFVYSAGLTPAINPTITINLGSPRSVGNYTGDFAQVVVQQDAPGGPAIVPGQRQTIDGRAGTHSVEFQGPPGNYLVVPTNVQFGMHFIAENGGGTGVSPGNNALVICQAFEPNDFNCIGGILQNNLTGAASLYGPCDGSITESDAWDCPSAGTTTRFLLDGAPSDACVGQETCTALGNGLDDRVGCDYEMRDCVLSHGPCTLRGTDYGCGVISSGRVNGGAPPPPPPVTTEFLCNDPEFLAHAPAGYTGLAGDLCGVGCSGGTEFFDCDSGASRRTYASLSPARGGCPLSRVNGVPHLAGGAGARTDALLTYGNFGYALNHWIPAQNGWGITLIGNGISNVTDAVAYDNDPLSGGATVTSYGSNFILFLEYDAVTGLFGFSGNPINSFFFPGASGRAISAFRRRAAGTTLFLTDGIPGELWRLLPGQFLAEKIGNVGDRPRQLRFLGALGVGTNFEGDSLTVFTWDDATDAVAIAGTVAVGDGPIGLHLRRNLAGNVEALSTGFNDHTYTIVELSPGGAVLSGPTTRPVPDGGQNPVQGLFVDGAGTRLAVSCNGSDEVVIFDR